MPDIQNLFSVPVFFYKLGRKFTQEELNYILSLETIVNNPNLISKNKYVLEQKPLSDLKVFIEKSLKDYFVTVFSPKTNTSIQLTQSWTNYTKPLQWHPKHKHSNSFLSGCLYIKTNKEKDRIYFHNDNYKQLKIPSSNWNLWNSDHWWFPVEEGDLILFPSYISHSVEEVKGIDTRISLAFNSFPTGEIGEEYATLFIPSARPDSE